MPMSRKSSLRVVLVLLLVGLLGGLLLLAAVAFSSSVSVLRDAPPDAVRAELEAVLARWPGPAWAELREVGGRWEAVVRPELEPPGARAPRTLYGLLWDPADASLVRVSVPALVLSATRWKLHVLGGAFAPLESRLGLSLKLPDPSRRGPGLVLDHTFPDGRRVLVWGE